MSAFGGQGGGLFGGQTKVVPQTGAQAAGYQPQKSLFGGAPSQPKPAGGLFGGLLSVNTGKPAGFGGAPVNAGQAGIAQGQPALNRSNTFGGGPPAGGGLFGGTAPAQATPIGGGGMFGGQAPAATNNAQQPAVAGGALFGGLTPQKPAGGGLFGAPVQQNQPASGLFGGIGAQATPAPAQGAGGLFGRGGQPAPVAGGMFGGLAATGVAGAQQPQQLGGFGLGQQAGAQQAQQLGINFNQQQQNLNQQQSPQFYEVQGIFTQQMLAKYGESLARSKPEAIDMQFQITKVPWRTRSLREFAPEITTLLSTKGKKIDNHLLKQQENLRTVSSTLNHIKMRMDTLESEIDDTITIMQSINNSQLTIGFQIQALKVDVSKIVHFRDQLGFQIQTYRSSENEYNNKIEVPSRFFFEMQKHHEKIVAMLDNKIEQAQIIAESLKDQAISKTQQQNSTTPAMLGVNLSKKELKNQIFEVCQLIYDQQKITASEMNQIERSIRKLRENFTRMVLKQDGGYLTSFEEVDALFENTTQKCQSEIDSEIKKIKQRNITAKMTDQIRQMDIKEIEKKKENESKKTIKAALKLKDKIYNPLLDDLSGQGSYFNRPSQMVASQNTQGSTGQQSYLGKRADFGNQRSTRNEGYPRDERQFPRDDRRFRETPQQYEDQVHRPMKRAKNHTPGFGTDSRANNRYYGGRPIQDYRPMDEMYNGQGGQGGGEIINQRVSRKANRIY